MENFSHSTRCSTKCLSSYPWIGGTSTGMKQQRESPHSFHLDSSGCGITTLKEGGSLMWKSFRHCEIFYRCISSSLTLMLSELLHVARMWGGGSSYGCCERHTLFHYVNVWCHLIFRRYVNVKMKVRYRRPCVEEPRHGGELGERNWKSIYC
jgi:hypothetical protein